MNSDKANSFLCRQICRSVWPSNPMYLLKSPVTVTLLAAVSLLIGCALENQPYQAFLGTSVLAWAHFWGWLGVTLFLLCLLSEQASRQQIVNGFIALTLCTVLSWGSYVYAKDTISQYHLEFIAVAWKFLVFLWVFALILRIIELIFPRNSGVPTWFVMLWPVLLSVGWEGFWEPFVDAHGHGPQRFQLGQQVADLLAFLLAWSLFQKSHSPEQEEAPVK